MVLRTKGWRISRRKTRCRFNRVPWNFYNDIFKFLSSVLSLVCWVSFISTTQRSGIDQIKLYKLFILLFELEVYIYIYIYKYIPLYIEVCVYERDSNGVFFWSIKILIVIFTSGKRNWDLCLSILSLPLFFFPIPLPYRKVNEVVLNPFVVYCVDTKTL